MRVGAHPDKTRLVIDLTSGVAASAGNVSHGPQGTAIEFGTVPTRMSAATTTGTREHTTAVAAQDLVDRSQVAQGTGTETAAAGQDIALTALTFSRGWETSGEIQLQLSDESAFELKRTTPNEYVLNIPGASATEKTTYPQIAPKGFPGKFELPVPLSHQLVSRFVCLSTREVDLTAVPKGTNIIIQSEATTSKSAGMEQASPAKDPTSRAQANLLEVDESGQAFPVEAYAPPGEEEEIGGSLEEESAARENPTGIRSADGSKIYTGRLISLDLQDTDIDNALRIIAEVSNLNIIASEDVTGKVTLRLIDVPWDQALDVILRTNGLDQVTEGNVIRIAPVDKLRQEREALSEAKRAQENLEDLGVEYLRVSYAQVDELREQVEGVLSERGTVTIDERTNQLIVKDIRKGQDTAMELISRLDLRTPQVLLETQIVEGQRNMLRDLGFQWNYSYVQSPATGNATGLNFPNTVNVSGGTGDGLTDQAVNFPAVLTDAAGSAITAVLDSADGSRSLTSRLSALETEGRVRVVSRPQVATVNNKQAEIRSVETVRVRVPGAGTSIATGAGAAATGGGATAFEEIDIGIELRVTPQASPDYYVLLDVNARSSAFGSTVVDNIPSTIEREANSTILVKSGQTFALGGVYRINDTDQIQGVPWLKDIPFFGALFRRTFVDKSDEELIFFITPHIVEGSFDPSMM